MKVRLTVLLENDKVIPIRDEADKEMLEQVLQKQYQAGFSKLVGPMERATVEKCEVVSGVYEK